MDRAVKFSETDGAYVHSYTSLFDAVDNKDGRAVSSLIRDGHNSNEVNRKGLRILHHAILIGHYDSVQILLLNGADPTIPMKNGWLGLHTAAYNGHADIVELIIKADCHPDLLTEGKETALYWAVDQGHLDVVSQLILSGCDVNARNCTDGRTALHHAAYTGKVEIVKTLIKSDADLSLMTDDERGWCALCIAAYEGHLEIIKALKMNLHDLNVKSKSGRTPLYWAAKNGRFDSIHILLEAGFNADTTDAIMRPIHKIKAIPVDMNAIDNYGWAPLHSAVFNKHIETVKLLLSNGANIDELTGSSLNWSALHIAVCYEMDDMVDLLLAHKASVNLKASNLNTPLHWAVHKKNFNLAKTLFEAGANPYLSNNLEKTPLGIALSRGYKDISILLRSHTMVKSVPQKN